jgi:hypothetical protein
LAIEKALSSLDTEQRVLSDVRNRTGLSFLKLGSIDPSSPSIATVLPVLAEWVSLLQEEDIRAAIYACFVTKYANSFIDQMLQWAMREPHELARGFLIQATARAARPKDGVRIWRELRKGRISDFDKMLLAKLSTFSSVEQDVKDHLVSELATNHWRVGDLQYISKVKDPRIVAWFAEHVDSPDRAIRTVARRVTQKHRGLPSGVSYAPAAPNRCEELFSTEIDVADIDRILADLTSRFGVQVPAVVRSDSTLWNAADVDRWMSLNVDLKRDPRLKSASTVKLWLRLEDVDVVEVVLGPE